MQYNWHPLILVFDKKNLESSPKVRKKLNFNYILQYRLLNMLSFPVSSTAQIQKIQELNKQKPGLKGNVCFVYLKFQ